MVGLVMIAVASGCSEEQCAAACRYYGDEEGHIVVKMERPWSVSTYDADLDLDGVAGAFTCTESDGAWSLTSPTGSGEAVSECVGSQFTIMGTPDSVEISVNAQDGSWIGSVKASPDYERATVCGTVCAPGAIVTVPKL
jgi:hypothetical protein